MRKTDQSRPARSATARLGILADANFRNLWLGRTISHMGDYAFRIAFSTYIITTTNSPTVLAAATAALLVPSLVFYLLGGVLSDAVRSRRTVMIVTDLLRAVVLLLIAAALTMVDSVGVLVGLALLIGVGEGFFQPASFGFMREVTPEGQLANANSAMSVSQQIGLIAGPVLGGLLVGLAGSTMAFVFDAVTFLVSAVFLALIRRPAAANDPAPDPATAVANDPAPDPATAAATAPDGTGRRRSGIGKVLSDIAAGFAYVRRQSWLSVTMTVGPAANAVFAGVLAVTVPLIMAPGGTTDAEMLGQFYAVQAVGAFSAALLVNRFAFTRPGPPMFLMLTLMATALIGVGLLGRTPVAYAMAFLYGVGLHFFNTLFPTLLHETVPDSVISRVSSLSTLAFTGLMPVGQLVIGPLAAGLSARTATVVAGTAAALLCLSAILAPSVRGLRRARPEPTSAAQPAGR